MPESDLEHLERFVVENEDLLTLEERIGRFNIFDALRIARREIRHSDYLAWILTPGESHGQGDLFLKALLMDILRKARQRHMAPPVSPIDLDGADLQGVEIKREWRNIDLLIVCDEPKLVIGVENKVDSGEHDNQLQRYEDTIAAAYPDCKRLHVFLTPEGEDASDEDWVSYSYRDLHHTFSRVLRTNAGAIGGDVGVFLNHYLSLIGNRFMENEDIDKLCRQIYQNHSRALDLIWERVGAAKSGLVGSIEEWIKARPAQWELLTTKQKEIEFVPTAWRGMLPPVGRRKTFPSEHWMTVRIRRGRNRLLLYVIVCPTNDGPARKLLLDRLLRDRAEFGFATFFKRKELTEDWTRVLSDEICPLPEDDDPDAEAILESIEKRLTQFGKQTTKLPQEVRVLFSK